MDIACVILGIISLCRHSMPLSICTTCVGVLELLLIAAVSNNRKANKEKQEENKTSADELTEVLEKDKQRTTDGLCILASLFAIIVGVLRICTL